MYLTIRNQNINIYFNEVNANYSTLTREEEVELFNRVAAGDKKAESIIFNKMAKMAIAFAKLYTGDPELLEDLIQEANIGILDAIQKYDINSGHRFSTYAQFWMKANITKFLNENGLVRCSDQEERNNISYQSIDEYTDDDEDTTFGECGVFADRTAVTNDYIAQEENEALSEEISKRMSRLDSREKLLVRMKFGFHTGYEMEYPDIAKAWNETNSKKLTAERVRQIITSALKKMQ